MDQVYVYVGNLWEFLVFLISLLVFAFLLAAPNQEESLEAKISTEFVGDNDDTLFDRYFDPQVV